MIAAQQQQQVPCDERYAACMLVRLPSHSLTRVSLTREDTQGERGVCDDSDAQVIAQSLERLLLRATTEEGVLDLR